MMKAKLVQSSPREFVWEVFDDGGEVMEVNFMLVNDETDDGSPSWRVTLYPPFLRTGGEMSPHVWGGDLKRLGAFRDAVKTYLGTTKLPNAHEFPARPWNEIEAALTKEHAFS